MGDVHGDESVTQGANLDENIDPGVDDQFVDDDDEASSDDAHPLLIFYDCETTGFSVYKEHITDIAAKVVACPVPLQTPTFSSLVKTSLRIPVAGMCIQDYLHNNSSHLQ